MGQFRPTLQARRALPADLALFGAGCFLSSAASFALAAWIGGALSSALPLRIRLSILLGTVLVLLVIDLARSRRGLQCSLGLRRQTPRRLGFQPIGPLLWGLDTGLPLTTYRATPLPFIGLACVALGFGHPWIGLAYAAGFLGSLVVSCAWPGPGGLHQPERRDLGRDPLRVIEALRACSRPAWTASVMVGFLLALFLSALAAWAAPAPEPDRISVRGRIQVPPGLAPADIEVRLLPMLSPDDQGALTLEGRLLPDAAATARPDGRGDFELTAPHTGRWSVRISAPGYLDRELDLVSLTEPVRLPPVQLEKGDPVEIRVIDGAGKAVAQAQVAAGPTSSRAAWRDAGRVALTDDAGRAVLLRSSGQRSVSAAAAGYLPARVPVVGGSGASTTIVLHHAARLRGVVRNRAGAPVPDARIRARALLGGDPEGFGIALRNPPGQARARADGSFVLSGLVAGLHYSVRAEAAGYAGTEAAVVLEKSAREKAGVEIVLSAGSSAFGRVVDSAGEPVAGAQLLLRLSSASEPSSLPFLAGPDAVEPPGAESRSGTGGELRVDQLTPGTYDLTVRAPGFSTKQMPAIEIAATPTDLGEIALEPGAVLRGRVVSRRGEPIAGATVSAWLQSPDGRNALGFGDRGDRGSDATAITSADGAFRLNDLRAGAGFDLTVTRKGYAEKLVPGVRAPAQQVLEIVIEEAARISGRVLDADRRPLENAVVAVEPQASLGPGSGSFLGGPEPAGGRTDGSGEFALDDVPPGPLRLRVVAEGWKPKELEDLEVGPGESIRDLEIVLERGAAVAGRVLDAQGRPAGEAFLAILDPGVRTNISARADGDGRYRLEGVEPGLRQVEVRWRDRRLTRELEVAPGENALDLRFERGTQVSGRVIDSAGSPVAGAQVALVAPGAGPMGMAASTETGADGAFRLADVLDGSYRLRAEAQGYARSVSDQTVEVTGAPVSGLEVQLSSGATLRGRLIGLEAKEAAGAQVSALLRTKGLLTAGLVRPDGSYEIPGLVPGRWLVTAVAGGSGRTAEAPIEIAGGATEELLDLELKGGLRLTGTVLRAGQPVAGIHVSVRPLEAESGAMAATDHEGRFELTGLDPGPYKVSVAVANGSTQTETITLAADDEIRIEIDTSRLAGHVIDASTAQPIAGAAVSLELLDRAAADDIPVLGSGEATDATGFFRIEDAAGGRYRLRIEKNGYAVAEVLLTVTAGIDQEGLEIRLMPNRTF